MQCHGEFANLNFNQMLGTEVQQEAQREHGSPPYPFINEKYAREYIVPDRSHERFSRTYFLG
jgi:hypothetical protein